HLGDIGSVVESVAIGAGFTVVREYVGHGIGTAMHEEPPVPNYGQPGRGIRIKEGYVLAIEPMVNQGKPETETLDDGWTVVTRERDGFAETADAPYTGALVLRRPVVVSRLRSVGGSPWQSPKTTPSSWRGRSSSPSPMRCSESNSRTATRCWPTSRGRCG